MQLDLCVPGRRLYSWQAQSNVTVRLAVCTQRPFLRASDFLHHTPLYMQPDAKVKRFFPFSEGRRDCIGQALAKTNYTAVLASLLSRFHFELAPEVVPTMWLNRVCGSTHLQHPWRLLSPRGIVVALAASLESGHAAVDTCATASEQRE